MFCPGSYTVIISWLPRLLGLIYFFTFGALLFQIKGLIGSKGILPLSEFFQQIRKHYPKNYFNLVPSIFWASSRDDFLLGVVAGGTFLSLLLVLGVYPSFLLFLLYILYLSIVSAGQQFLSFGWEGFLLEITVNAFFLSLTTPANIMVWISINLLLFRFNIQAGIVKLQSGDRNWRNLSAVAYHYQSQPLPNMIAWYAHKLPLWFHKLSTLIMFIIELIVPFGMFGNESIRLLVFGAFFGLQLMIWITGNFSYLNHLTVVISSILIGNSYLPQLFHQEIQPVVQSGFSDFLCTIVGAFLTSLQIMRLCHHFFPNPLISSWLQKLTPYHIVNQYGIFAIMTTTRHEVVFEGSYDGIEWKEYSFFYKPSEINRRPRRISPYQPRIDWQAWFLPLGNFRYESWFLNFRYSLLAGAPEVLAMLRINPFTATPPLYIRTLLYEYEFSSKKEKKETGSWWRRKCLGIFTHPVKKC